MSATRSKSVKSDPVIVELPRWNVVSTAIGKVTFTEILRDKILYNVLICGVLLFGLGYLASRLTFVKPERVVLDFGQTAIRLSCTMIAIFLGAGLVGREFERRTIQVALSHPITRFQFILGKFIGIAGVIAINWALISLVYFGMLFFMYGFSFSFMTGTLLAALLLNLMQGWVVAAATVLMSTFSTTSLSAMFSVGLCLVGTNVSELRSVIEKIQSPAVRSIAGATTHLLPNLQYFDLGLFLTYGLPIGVLGFLGSILYGVVVSAVFITLAGALIRLREV